MPVQLSSPHLQTLVNQMLAKRPTLSQNDVQTLIDTAMNEGQGLTTEERDSLQTLLDSHHGLFEDSEVRTRLESFQKIASSSLTDAAHRFAADGRISASEAEELGGMVRTGGSVSTPDKLSLKALMGFYSRELEPGAEQVLQGLTEGADVAVEEAASTLKTELGSDGSVGRSELVEAEDRLAATYGREQAKDILIRALGQEPGKIEFEAVDYLQGRVGSMQGHVKTYQKVLSHHLAGAKLLDANFDGKLDENDLIFTKDADGKVNTQRIGKALRDRVVIGGAMIDAAHDMGKAKHRFGDLEANPVVWEVDEDNPNVMYSNGDFPPSVALMDIFNNPEMYSFECATAMVILRYKAMLDLIGEEDFNRICDDLRIGVWDQEDHAAAIWKVSGQSNGGEQVDMTAETKAEMMPGDYAYFKNWDVTEAAFKGGWQGENVIFLGEGKYYGHPFGITEGTKIVKYLNKHRNIGSTRSASLLDLHARVSEDVLKYDKLPNK
jgi:protein-glutamine gamma-glutamyltransferase